MFAAIALKTENYHEKFVIAKCACINDVATLIDRFSQLLRCEVASQLVYILSPLPSSHHGLKEIKMSFFKFLWDGKQDKVKRTEIINDFAEGGLKMLDLQ